MKKNNNDSTLFEKKSRFNNNRDSYVDENGNYVYTRWTKRSNGKWERVVVDIIPLTAENKDIIILLDEDDHNIDLRERYDEENADYGFRKQQEDYAGNSESENDFNTNPLENIVSPNGDIFEQLHPDEETFNPEIEQIEEFICEKLTPEQQDMVYAHLGERKYLEDLRREEVAKTGKEIKKQAIQQRWDRIIKKACKEFGVEKPKQIHKKRSE